MTNICECIEWVDHSNFARSIWRPLEDIRDLTPFEVISVGFTIKETSKYIIIVSHLSDEDNSATGEMCILKATIKSRHKIKVINDKKKKLDK